MSLQLQSLERRLVLKLGVIVVVAVIAAAVISAYSPGSACP
jgi:hypothetical protein